jgi:hypothetical protein
MVAPVGRSNWTEKYMPSIDGNAPRRHSARIDGDFEEPFPDICAAGNFAEGLALRRTRPWRHATTVQRLGALWCNQV